MLQLGSVLYIAAHPDDENTRFLAWSARGRGYRTGYLSLTRGGGGQNLIGEEKGVQLGVIRTQELLQARRRDGAVQFFSRANDFGYSKTPSETFGVWDRRKLLADMVWVIRTFRPDVLVTRFSPERAGKTHGHHTASAMLAEEAFSAAGDPGRFPEQLQYVEVWSPRKLYWNTSWWFYGSRNYDKTEHVAINVGAYNPWLGRSYHEIGSEARTQHKSQGFGSAPERGALAEFFDPIAGATADTTELMAGIETSWDRIPGSESVRRLLQRARKRFEPGRPHEIVPLLARIYQKMENLEDHYLLRQKKNQLARLMARCAGLYMDFTSSRHLSTPGDQLETRLRAVVRNPSKVIWEDADIYLGRPSAMDSQPLKTLRYQEPLTYNRLQEEALEISIGSEAPISQPYWLRRSIERGLFQVPEQQARGLAQNPPALSALMRVRYGTDGPQITYHLPLEYTGTDPVEGEVRHRLAIAPPVTAHMNQKLVLFREKKAQSIPLRLRRTSRSVSGKAFLQAPEGWNVSPSVFSFRIEGDQVQHDTMIRIEPTSASGTGQLTVRMQVEGRSYFHDLDVIDYRHIPRQYHFPEATARLIPINLETGGRKIAYVPGAGDEVPEALRAVGYQVDILDPNALDAQQLAGYDAVVTGIRFFNVHEQAKQLQLPLLEYCREGGTLIYQYSKSYNLKTQDIGPYDMDISRDRITVEGAELALLVPRHPIFKSPNAIRPEDFDGWVQERGLYFAGSWSDAYTPLLEGHDPGESPKKGMLLIAHYGQGAFIYTGLSFFRQLPAGIPGAYRLFANMLAYQPTS